MSIVIKGIDLPKEGEQHRIIVRHNGQVILCREVCYEKGKAIQIPKNHGDIKDINTFLKDKCLTQCEDGYGLFDYKFVYLVSTEAIHNAPTILEAEEDE